MFVARVVAEILTLIGNPRKYLENSTARVESVIEDCFLPIPRV
jgi:hypothetical protein